jgi:hypothetical protein
MNSNLLTWRALHDVISLLDETIVGCFLNHHLSDFYKDMANLSDISFPSKDVTVDLIERHLEAFKNSSLD